MMYDASTQEQIYRDYYDKVFAYTINRTRSREDAEDLTSEIFIKVYNKLNPLMKKRLSFPPGYIRSQSTAL